MAVCRYCKTPNLIWDEQARRLRDGSWAIHTCAQFTAAQEQRASTPTAKCKRCGTERLSWRDVEGKWVLYDGNLPHSCEQAPGDVQARSATAKCRRCGCEGLTWKKDNNGKWRLYMGRYIHDCGDGFDNEPPPPPEPQGLPEL
jgi:ribosomal protein L40E